MAFGAVLKKDRYYWTGEGEVAATKIPLKLLGRVSKETKSVLNTNYILVKKIKVAAKQNHPLNISELKLKRAFYAMKKRAHQCRMVRTPCKAF